MKFPTPNEERILKLRDIIWNLKDLNDQVGPQTRGRIMEACASLTLALKDLENLNNYPPVKI